ncbi:MAG: hypothetical protein COA52_07595 [Hyphomicrobiales bacterium]|nr:MAG: hypothetical protein COA52_07595 [Hyphomicrobiales bacterium]
MIIPVERSIVQNRLFLQAQRTRIFDKPLIRLSRGVILRPVTTLHIRFLQFIAIRWKTFGDRLQPKEKKWPIAEI